MTSINLAAFGRNMTGNIRYFQNIFEIYSLCLQEIGFNSFLVPTHKYLNKPFNQFVYLILLSKNEFNSNLIVF